MGSLRRVKLLLGRGDVEILNQGIYGPVAAQERYSDDYNRRHENLSNLFEPKV